jgi:hypothetical protein
VFLPAMGELLGGTNLFCVISRRDYCLTVS